MDTANLKKTALARWHEKAGAKMVDFGGWYMPVRYSGIVEEHARVRNAAGLFDVSHMGQFSVTGQDALGFLQYVTCNDLSKIQPGKAQYNALLYANGTVVDDLIIYQCAANDYLIVVNASNIEKDFQYLQSILGKQSFNLDLRNLSDSYALIAIQGPEAVALLSRLKKYAPALELKYFEHCALAVNDYEVRIARTGYTGEDGFEIFLPVSKAENVWTELIEVGSDFGLLPIGLGARDTLRLEACYPLYGHELSADYTALESGLAWICKFNKESFLGKDILKNEKELGSKKTLVGFEVLDAGIVREGALVYTPTGVEIGVVTSGTKTPTVNKSIGMAIVKTAHANLGTNLLVRVRDKDLNMQIVKKPFYKRLS